MPEVLQVSFGKLYTHKTLRELCKADKSLKKQTTSIARLLRKNNLHKTKYTDVILNYDEGCDKFYGVISSKKQGTPMNPYYRSPKIEKGNLQTIIEWLTEWDEMYNPKTIRKMNKIQEKTVAIMTKNAGKREKILQLLKDFDDIIKTL